MRRCVILPIASTVLGTACATHKPFLQTATELSRAVERTADSVQKLPSTIENLCRKSVELDYLFERLNPIARTSTAAGWVSWHRKHDADDWSRSCGDFRPVEQSIEHTVTALREYGAALGAASAEAGYAGSDMTDLAKSVSDAGGQISPVAGKYKDDIKGLGDPLTKVADKLFAIFVQAKAETIVAGADDDLQTILEKLRSLIHTAKSDLLKNARDNLGTDLNSIEAMRADPGRRCSTGPDPASGVTSFQFAMNEAEALDAIEKDLDGWSKQLGELSRAHKALAQAASAQKEQQQALIKRTRGIMSRIAPR